MGGEKKVDVFRPCRLGWSAAEGESSLSVMPPCCCLRTGALISCPLRRKHGHTVKKKKKKNKKEERERSLDRL